MEDFNILGLHLLRARLNPTEDPLHVFNQKAVVVEVAWTLEAAAFHHLVAGAGVAST